MPWPRPNEALCNEALSDQGQVSLSSVSEGSSQAVRTPALTQQQQELALIFVLIVLALSNAPVAEAAPLPLNAGVVTASFTTGMLWSATQYYGVYKTVSVIDELGEDVMRMSDDVCWHVQEALSWGLYFMKWVTMIVYTLWCFNWLYRRVTDVEQRHRRYASDWPTWYAPMDTSKVSGGWRTSLEQMIAKNQRLKPQAPLALEDARMRTSSVSQASWAGSHFKSWRACLKRNQAPPLLEEGVLVFPFMSHYPAVMPLTRASHKSPVISQEKDILSLILEMISLSIPHAKGIRIGCYGIDKAEIVNALIEAAKVQKSIKHLSKHIKQLNL